MQEWGRWSFGCAFDLVGRHGVCVILIDFELQTINAVASRWFCYCCCCSTTACCCCYCCCYCYCPKLHKRVQLMFASGFCLRPPSSYWIRVDSHTCLLPTSVSNVVYFHFPLPFSLFLPHFLCSIALQAVCLVLVFCCVLCSLDCCVNVILIKRQAKHLSCYCCGCDYFCPFSFSLSTV